MKKELLSARHLSLDINKEYAYKDLNFSVFENELLGVCELPHLKKVSRIKQLTNPSTTIRGEIYLEGKKLGTKSRMKSSDIYYISEESTLIDSLSITDNLFAVRKIPRGRMMYNEKTAEEMVKHYLKTLQLPIDLNTPVSSLTKSMGHLLQIVKAILLNARIIVLDNITDDYNIKEYEHLIDVIDQYKKDGRTFIFFSTRENRLTEHADRIYVLCRHKLAGQIFHEEYSSKLLFDMLHGEKIMPLRSRRSTIKERTVFSSDFSGMINKTFDFSIREGEIIGILDLYGSYTNTIVNYFMSGFPYRIGNKKCKNYQRAVKNGLAVISLSESGGQIFPDFSVTENLTFQILPKISRGLIINKRIQKYCGEQYLKEIQVPDKRTGREAVSGIRLLMYKWLLASPALFVLDNLTIGMDNSGQRKFRQIVDQAASQGTACMILTSVWEECLNICDKIWVIEDDSRCRLYDMNMELQNTNTMEEFKSHVNMVSS